MKNRVLITSVLLLSVIGVNRVFAQKYENNRYGLTLEKKENGYVLKDAKTIERLEVFDIEKAPADMFVPYKHKMRKLKSEDFNQCTTLHYVFKEYPNHKLVIEVDLPKNNKDKKYRIWYGFMVEDGMVEIVWDIREFLLIWRLMVLQV